MLKPIDSDDLKNTVNKIKKYNDRMLTHSKLEEILSEFSKSQSHKKITITSEGKLHFIKVDDIIFVESDGNYSTLFLEGNQKMVVIKKLKEVGQILPDNLFFRIHNSYIINLGKVKEYIKSDGYVVMDSGNKIPVARQRKSDFLEKF